MTVSPEELARLRALDYNARMEAIRRIGEQGHHRTCRDICIALLAENDNDPQLWILLGVANSSLKRYQEAALAYDRALALGRLPADLAASLEVSRGVVLVKLGRNDEALQSWERALTYDIRSMNIAVWVNQGNLSFLRRQLDEAIALYDRALAEEPLHRDALRGKVRCLFRLGRLKEAFGLLVWMTRQGAQ